MALPSQTERGTNNGRSVMVQPGGANATRIAIVVAGLVLLAGGIYGLSQWSGGARPADASTPESKPESKLATKPATPTKVAPDDKPDSKPDSKLDPKRDPKSDPILANKRAIGTDAKAPAQPPLTPATSPESSVATKPSPLANDPATPAPQPTGGAHASTTAPSGTSGASTPTTALAPAPGTTSDSLSTTNLDLSSASLIAQGDAAVSTGKLVEARALLSRALLARDTDEPTKETLRTKLTQLNANLVFSPTVTPGDSLVESYQVQSGDSLVRIAKRRELATDWRLIQRVNRIANPNALKLGQTVKLVKGPFHAVVNKNAYRVDVYAGSPEEPAGWLYIKSYRAGLGESDTTPLGNYVIKNASKLVNPPWTNPRTGEKFGADDPKNPIGEHWIGWQGVGESKGYTGYGFHGTIDPASIGQQKSMGCVRLASEDVAELYELLVEEVSVVRVLP
jgi:lipoprotein-anchoring transpeptidase ErfK/SrfK